MRDIQNSDHQLTGAADICIAERSLILTQFYPFGSSIGGISTNVLSFYVNYNKRDTGRYYSLCANNP